MSYEGTFETPRRCQNKVELITKATVSDTIRRVAKFERELMVRSVHGDMNIPLPTTEQIAKYLVTLLKFRIDTTNGEVQGKWKTLWKTVRIPSRWNVFLVNIGRAVDSSRNLTFIPRLDEDTYIKHGLKQEEKDEILEQAEDLYSKDLARYENGEIDMEPELYFPIILMGIEEFREMSDDLDFLTEEGYTTVKGMERSTEGKLELMAKTKIQEIIRGIDAHNPVYGFLAYILDLDIASQTYDDIGILFRVQYSSYDVYDASFKSFFREVGTIDSETASKSEKDSATFLNPGDDKIKTKKVKTGKGKEESKTKSPEQLMPGLEPPNLDHKGNGVCY